MKGHYAPSRKRDLPARSPEAKLPHTHGNVNRLFCPFASNVCNPSVVET